MKKTISPSASIERWEVFFKALIQKVAEPTPQWPTVRCWSRSNLITVLVEIRNQGKAPLLTTFPHGNAILDHLQKTGLVSHIEVEAASPSPSTDFYLLDFDGTSPKEVDPLELLQAFKPAGIICYFSALSYYGLTTQIASQHHIATLSKPSSTAATRNDGAQEETSTTGGVKRNPLGEKAFTFQSVPCFWTRRTPSRLVGIQIRAKAPRTRFRITTLEQTLLDTLHRPFSCGGLSVILEAWEKGSRTMDEQRLTEHLATMAHTDTYRRVGALLDLMGNPAPSSLKAQLDEIKNGMPRPSPESRISLLPGIDFPNTNETWQVGVP